MDKTERPQALVACKEKANMELRSERSQIVRGLKPREGNRIKPTCLVVSCGWPSWLFGVEAFNLDVTRVRACRVEAKWVDEFKALYPAMSVEAVDSVKKLWDPGGLARPDVILSQGSLDLLNHVTPDWLAASVCIHSRTLGDKTTMLHKEEWSQVEMAQSQHGGVMCGEWQFYCNRGAKFGELRVNPCARRIRHVVDTVTLGRLKPVPEPEADYQVYDKAWELEGSRALDWNGTLPSARPLSRVRCRSVFTDTRWTIRGLSAKELGSVFDLPIELARSLKDWRPGQRHNLPFLKAAPAKLLRAVWDRVEFGTEKKCLPLEQIAGEEMEHKSAVLDEAPAKTAQKIAEDETQPEVADYSKATKADDAAVPIALWDNKVWELGLHCSSRVAAFIEKWSERRREQGWSDWKREPLNVIREVVVARWRKLVSSSFTAYMRKTFGCEWVSEAKAGMDREAGRECIARAAASTFWAWDQGSRPFYWRWPERVRKDIRDGFTVWIQGQLPNNRRPQRGEKDPVTRAQVKGKIDVARKRKYIEPGEVKNLTGYFPVPKGPTDIRMVYDATKSKLNQAIWTPSFALPSVESLTRQLEESTWMADLDLGDMFLNFMLDTELRPFCGIDLKPFFDGEEGDPIGWERWVRCMMGLRSSPYMCVKAMLIATEVICGDRTDPTNSYRWDSIRLNLPGYKDYEPSKPWICRIRADSGKIAGNTTTYVDDLRSMGESEKECWSTVHQTGSRVGYLGIQNAPRKTRPPSQTPGAWAGTVAETSENGIGVKCSQEKWSKAKAMIQEIQMEVDMSDSLDHKLLEQKRGFFVHIQRTYPNLTPFIKGMHLTLDGWRPGRDSEMWKHRCAPEVEGYWDAKEEVWIPANLGSLKPPKVVKPAPRLKDDLEMLSSLMSADQPPLRLVRTKHISVAIYGFVDASGVGFGSSVETKEGLLYRYGLWGRDADDTSSNYKELRNLVEAIEEGVESGDLKNSELFIFTDNSTAEGAYYKGNTGSRLLFELVLRLRQLNMQGNIILHVIHVAGTRMISQGTDALSRGDLQEGVMAGQGMLTFVPLQLNVMERSGAVLEWVRSWAPDKEIVPLSEEDWYERGHGWHGGAKNDEGIWVPTETTEEWFLWTPPPVIADAALDEMLTSRHKRSHLNHIFVCPRLMTQLWRKKLHKLSDLVFEIPAGARAFWPREMHEPLIVGLTFGFARRRPWQLRYSQPVLDLGSQLREVWKDKARCERSVLRKLCDAKRVLDSLPEGVV